MTGPFCLPSCFVVGIVDAKVVAAIENRPRRRDDDVVLVAPNAVRQCRLAATYSADEWMRVPLDFWLNKVKRQPN